MLRIFTGALIAVTASLNASANFVTVSNEAYFSVIDCTTRLPIAVIYPVSTDTANAERYPSYIDDEQLKSQYPQCHPNTDHRYKTYQAVATKLGVETKYDVGHLAMSNHLDGTDELSRLANQFSNLAPQAAKKNRRGGAWYTTEMQIECLRDIEPLIVIAGTIDNASTTENDHFVETFGQTTPDFWYRLIYLTQSKLYKAYIIPNLPNSDREALERGHFDVSLNDLEMALPVELELIKQIQQGGATEAPDHIIRTTVSSSTLTCQGKTTSVS